jgi:FAD/FMN-containing dehydrogenase
MSAAPSRPLDLDRLRRAVSGAVFGPDDGEAWDGARRPWSLGIDQRPAAVVEVSGADDVAAAIGFARENGLGVMAQPTGHAATWDLHDVVLLRTGALGAVEVDAGARLARVGAGARWRDVQVAAAGEGLSGLMGTAPHVCITGYLLGGGLSWMGRRYGLATNGVRAFEVVSADGRRLRADADSEPDLFWALKGGGGNYAIVTGLEIELFPVAEVYAGNLMWPMARSGEVLNAWREWVQAVPDEVTSIALLLRVPPLPTVPEPMRGQELVVLGVCFTGPEAEGAELLAPLRALGPIIDTFATMPPAGLGAVHMDPEDPAPSIGTTAMVRELPGEAVDRLVEAAGPDSGAMLLFAELRQLGGALARPHPNEGAAGHLEEAFLLHALGMPMAPEHPAAITASCERLQSAMAPWTTGRTFLNFVEEPEAMGSSFPPEVLTRLADVKRRYDPKGLIHSSHTLGTTDTG